MSNSTAPINCIMLIDDNKIDNFFHERVIRKNAAANYIIAKESAEDALLHLQDPSLMQPDVIFLDINMPGMNGWEFIEQYKKMDNEMKSMIVVMLTTSENPDDLAIARSYGVLADFKSKPLTSDMLQEITASYYKQAEKSK